MNRQGVRRHGFEHRAQHRACPGRRTHSDRITQRNLGTAGFGERVRHAHDAFDRHFALVGAAENAGDVATDPHALLTGPRQDRSEPGQRFRNRAVDVFLIERFGGGGENGDFIGAGRARPGIAFFVWDQHRVAHAGTPLETGHDLLGVGQLWNPTRRHETGGLDHLQTAVRQSMDELELGFGRHIPRFVLEPIARTHFDNQRRFLCHAV